MVEIVFVGSGNHFRACAWGACGSSGAPLRRPRRLAVDPAGLARGPARDGLGALRGHPGSKGLAGVSPALKLSDLCGLTVSHHAAIPPASANVPGLARALPKRRTALPLACGRPAPVRTCRISRSTRNFSNAMARGAPAPTRSRRTGCRGRPLLARACRAPLSPAAARPPRWQAWRWKICRIP